MKKPEEVIIGEIMDMQLKAQEEAYEEFVRLGNWDTFEGFITMMAGSVSWDVTNNKPAEDLDIKTYYNK